MQAPNVLTITVRSLPSGRDEAWCTWKEREFRTTSGAGAEMKLARMLVAAGAPDQPWQSAWPDGRPSMSGKSLHRMAMTTINNTTGRFTAWKGVDFTRSGSVVTKRCGGCGETGYVFEKVCLACATREAHGGLTPTELVRARAQRKQAPEFSPGLATAAD